ncbi:MAG: TonB-dependent receptor [Hyphomicrobiales bacterium]|nr:TonB-dependent receptor [Hyphomicrobiales bacterium]
MQSQIQTFDRARDNIFAPLGTAPSTLSREAIEALPQGTNATVRDVLMQLPGVSQDTANQGGVHVRNEHAYVSYRINGILLPDGLGAFGQYLDSSWIGSLSLITGALPAQYGLRTAGIVDITTAKLDNVGQIGTYMGSRHTSDSSIQYGGTTGSTEYFLSGRYLQNSLGINNTTPALNALHDHTTQDRDFAYISTIIDPTTRLSFIGGTATNQFQIPDRLNCPSTPNPAAPAPTTCIPPNPFTAFGVANYPSWMVNENQHETYKFGLLALQKSTSDVDLQLSYFMRTSAISFTPDRIGDLMYNGVATDVYRGSIVNGIQGDSAFFLNEAHTLRAGFFVSAEKTTVANTSQLLPFDSTTGAQILPDVPFGAVDSSVLLGWLGGVYLQDEWKLTDTLTLNTGARFDQMWQYQNANQLSPRVSLTYTPNDGTTFHAGYARTFTPPVQVIAAPTNTNLFTACPASIGIPTCTTVQAPGVPPPYAPLLPERANVYDIGVVQKMWPGLELGIDAYLKSTRDLLDDGQFGAAQVLDGFNYAQAQNTGVELKAGYTNGNFRAYANWAWAVQRATNIITNQYLFAADELAYIQNNWIYTDHTQIWTGSGGVSYLWDGTRFTTDVIYGSGFRAGFVNTDHVPSYVQVNAGMSHEFYIPGWNPITARFDVVNVFDTSYVLRTGTGIGVFAPQYGPRRGYFVGLAQKFGPGANKPPPAPPTYVPVSLLGYAPLISKDAIQAPWTWTGFYIGGNVGYSTGKFNSDALFSDSFGNPLSASSSSLKHYGAIGGGQIGYNWQAGTAVAGLETDIVFAHQRTTDGPACAGSICNPAITLMGFDAPVAVAHEHNLDWFGTLRARLGVAVTPDMLLYGTGGLAFGEVEHQGTIYGAGIDSNGNIVPAANVFSNRMLREGWAAGGGLEARLLGNLTGKVEYLHVDLGHASAPFASLLSNSTPLTIAFNSHITEDLVRVGLNYKFDPGVIYVAVDPTPPKPALERVRPVYKTPTQALWTWTGFYFGANVGYATGSFDSSTLYSDASTGTPLFGGQSSTRRNGFNGGVQTGYNLQWGSLLAGVETDIQASTQRNISSSACPGAVCNPGLPVDTPITVDHSHNLDWFGTVRGRLGVAVTPDLVAYGTGGLAVGGIAHSASIAIGGVTAGIDANGNPTGTPMTFTTRSTKTGYAVGGGIETHLAGNVTGKIEYLHMSFGNDYGIGSTNTQNTPPTAVSFASHVTDDIVRLGLNYKFDPNADAPVYQAVKSSAPPLILKPPVPWLWTWNGYYLGVNAGYGWGRSNTDAFFNDIANATAFRTNSSAGVRGSVLGIQTGYNFVSGRWLWGVEADLSLTGQVGNPIFTCPAFTCNPNGAVVAAFDQNQKIDWFGTLRQRWGVLVTPDLLVYGSYGAAIAGISTAGNVFGFDPNGIPAISAFSNRSINAGWAAGGGVEAHLGGHWTGKVEYLYMKFGSATTNMNNQGIMTLTTQFNSRSITDQLLRVGLNYKFDPFAAVYDAPTDAKSPMLFKAPMRVAWTWAGPYVGTTIGYGVGKSLTDTSFTDPASEAELFATNGSRKLEGMIGGAQVGYNWLDGILLTGVEGDLNYSDQRAKLRAICPGEICNPDLIGVVGDPSVIAQQGQKLEWFATLRARLGLTVAPAAIAYVTGGVAVGEVMTAGTVFGFDANGNQVNTIISSHNTKAGLAAGGGIEARLSGNWTGKVEYLYLDFGAVNTIPAPAPYATTAIALNSRITDNILRVGVNYKFDPNEIWPY